MTHFRARVVCCLWPDCSRIEPGIYLPGKSGVRSEIDVYVRDKDIEITGQPIQTEIVPISCRSTSAFHVEL